MFLALGVGAWTAAIFHLFTHAFFMALLFLSAGVVIDAMPHHDHNIFHMGGLRKKLPVAYWSFLIGAASLSSLPLVTAGFFSKDNIIWASFASRYGSVTLWLIALLVALITAIYSFRAVFLMFYGPDYKKEIVKKPGQLMTLSLGVLSFFAITAGYLGLPPVLGGSDWFARFLLPALPETPISPARDSHTLEALLVTVSAVIALLGIYLGYVYFKNRQTWEKSSAWKNVGIPLRNYFHSGWGFDWIYTRLFVWPYVAINRANRKDLVDKVFTGLGLTTAGANRALSATETGQVRNYVIGLVLGAILCVAVLLFRH
jgi:NADH-quinone oxidoreductase subunit L